MKSGTNIHDTLTLQKNPKLGRMRIVKLVLGSIGYLNQLKTGNYSKKS